MDTSLLILTSDNWRDYELVDSGERSKLEKFGRYSLVRPEPQAIWPRALEEREWERADATFVLDAGGKGVWQVRHPLDEPWMMRYRQFKFLVRPTPFRHTGVFPDQAVLWDWIGERCRPGMRVLNLFGYTGLASLFAAAAGAEVTHVDASKPALQWAKDNQAASGLKDRPIRWLHDDVVKFVRREIRRGRKYDGLLMDPPPYGHGSSGETWRFFDGFPELLALSRQVLAERPRFVVITAYAIVGSALLLQNLLTSTMEGRGGSVEAGELAVRETSAGRLLSTAHFARWRV